MTPLLLSRSLVCGLAIILAPLSVSATESAPTFERDVQPILTRFGCNAGACHGKARGQNGFALSLLAYDHDGDYAAIVQEARGRRILPAAPASSPLLLKATGQVPHGGGKKFGTDHFAYRTLLQWINFGTPRTPTTMPKLTRISVSPTKRLLKPNETQQLTVVSHFTDGTSRDVTHLAAFQSNESVYAAVDANGLIKAGPLPGEAAIMARYDNHFAIVNVLMPLAGSVPYNVYAKLPRTNPIDGPVWDKLQLLGITPSEVANDATFHRRAYLDVIGRQPTPDETRRFLADADPKKRETLIDTLLARPEYADFWANKWADLLRPNPYHVGIKATYNLDAWLRESFRQNKPYDRFVRELITAQGSTFRNGATVWLRDRRLPEEITTIASQLFLGIRLDCAKCHHHPFEVYSQDDFYSFAAYFANISRRGTGISAPISGSEEIVFSSTTSRKGGVKHPLTGRVMSPKPLFGDAPDTTDRDPRQILADWVTSKDNPYFAKVMANRVWAELMGRGIVDPVDDLRATNPPTNAALLDVLADDFRANNFDIKKLIRRIATSHVYALSSKPSERNAADIRNYSRHYRQRLRAEVLLDAVSDITGIAETFAASPPGSRAMQQWTVRNESLFLDSFGRPDPNQDPPCERTPETSVVQALHLMNAPGMQAKLTSDGGRVQQLAESKKSNEAIIEELYLLVYCRMPTADERSACLRQFAREGANGGTLGGATDVAKRRAVIEDLLWAMLNTPEFVFKD